MKGILYFFGGCLVIGLIVSFTLNRLPVLPLAGKAILVLFQQGQYQQAYNSFSKEFQKHYPLPVFTTMVQKSGLMDYKDVHWSRNEISADKKTGLLTGTVTTKQNTRLYIEIDFVTEQTAGWGTAWLIADLRVKRSEDSFPSINPDSTSAPPPIVPSSH